MFVSIWGESLRKKAKPQEDPRLAVPRAQHKAPRKGAEMQVPRPCSRMGSRRVLEPLKEKARTTCPDVPRRSWELSSSASEQSRAGSRLGRPQGLPQNAESGTGHRAHSPGQAHRLMEPRFTCLPTWTCSHFLACWRILCEKCESAPTKPVGFSLISLL